MSFKKNPNIKPAGEETELTPEQLVEFKRCADDPVYFVKTYVKIQHPVRGSIPFKLYPYQEEMIRAYENNRWTIVLSSRQTGKSITSAAYLLWYAIFNFDKTILIASNKNSNAMEMIFRIRFAYEYLPMWLKPGVTEDGWNKHSLSFDNDSRIISTATSEDSGRGLSISLLFLDEFAFVKPGVQDEFWTSISPTLSTGGSCICTSTPNGDTNIFAQLWRGAQMGTNGFYPIRVRWDQPPGRDDDWKEDEIGRVGERRWRQEYECEFLSSDAMLLDSLFLQNITEQVNGTEVEFKIREVEFYEGIKPENTYLIGVDPATGGGGDFSVIEVYHFPSMRHVAEYRSNTMSQSMLYDVLKNLIKYIEKREGMVYFSVENNGVGQGVISLFEADDEPPMMSEFVSEEGRDKKGFTTTRKSKLRACVNMKEMMEKGRLNIASDILLLELKNFVQKSGSYEAQVGATDDCIAAILIVIRILEEIATYEQAAYEKLYSYSGDAWEQGDFEGIGDEYDANDIPMPMSFG